MTTHAQYGQYSRPGLLVAQMFVDGIESRGSGLGGVGIQPSLEIVDVRADQTAVAAAAVALLHRNVSFILLPPGINAIVAARAVYNSNHPNAKRIPLLAGQSADVNLFLARIPTVIGSLTPADRYGFPFMPIVKTTGEALTNRPVAAIISSDYSFDAHVCQGFLGALQDGSDDIHNSNAIIVRVPNGVQLIDTNHTGKMSSAYMEAQLRTALINARDSGAMFLFTCFIVECNKLFRILNSISYNPVTHLTFECINTIAAAPVDVQQAALYTYSPLQWSPELAGVLYTDPLVSTRAYGNLYPPRLSLLPPYGMLSSPQVFFEEYTLSAKGVALSSLGASQGAALYMIDFVVNLLHSCDPQQTDLVAGIQTMNAPSFYGLLNVGQTNQNANREMTQVQFLGMQAPYNSKISALNRNRTATNTTLTSPISEEAISLTTNLVGLASFDDPAHTAPIWQVVYPLQARPVLPAPTYAEQVFAPVFWGTTLEHVLLSCGGVVTIAYIVLLVLLCRFRQHPIVCLLDFHLSLFVWIGNLGLIWVPLVTWSLYTPWRLLCFLRPLLGILSLLLLFGALCTMNRRIYRIIDGGKIASRGASALLQEPWQRVVWLMTACASPTLVLLIIWLSLGNPISALFVSDVYRPQHNFVECTYGAPVVGALVLGSLGYLMGLCCYYSWHLRNLKSSVLQFNNAKRVATLVCNLVIFSAIVVGLEVKLSNDVATRPEKFLFRSSIFMAMSVMAQFIFFYDAAVRVAGSMERGGIINGGGAQLTLSVVIDPPEGQDQQQQSSSFLPQLPGVPENPPSIPSVMSIFESVTSGNNSSSSALSETPATIDPLLHTGKTPTPSMRSFG